MGLAIGSSLVQQMGPATAKYLKKSSNLFEERVRIGCGMVLAGAKPCAFSWRNSKCSFSMPIVFVSATSS